MLSQNMPSLDDRGNQRRPRTRKEASTPCCGKRFQMLAIQTKPTYSKAHCSLPRRNCMQIRSIGRRPSPQSNLTRVEPLSPGTPHWRLAGPNHVNVNGPGATGFDVQPVRSVGAPKRHYRSGVCCQRDRCCKVATGARTVGRTIRHCQSCRRSGLGRGSYGVNPATAAANVNWSASGSPDPRVPWARSDLIYAVGVQPDQRRSEQENR